MKFLSFYCYYLNSPFWYSPLTIRFQLEGIVYYIRGCENWGQLQRKGLSKNNKKVGRLKRVNRDCFIEWTKTS